MQSGACARSGLKRPLELASGSAGLAKVPTVARASKAGCLGGQVVLTPLEAGPSTVLGERTSLVDPVALELGQLLTAHADDLMNSEIEVELRLGVLYATHISKTSKRVGRVVLPVSTEVILRRAECFHYKFVPGLPVDAFLTLCRQLDAMCSDRVPPELRIECGRKSQHLRDTIYSVASDPGGPTNHPGLAAIRVTEDLTDPGAEGGLRAPRALAVRQKQKLGHFDLYTGFRPGEYGATYDLRAAVNSEVRIEGFEPGPGVVLNLTRDKRRKTYHFKCWRLDVSVVETSYPAPDEGEGRPRNISHEVELELDSYQLKRQLELKLAGANHCLWELLGDFVDMARDLAVLARETSPLLLPPLLPPPSQGPLSKEAVEAYRAKYGERVGEPVVGHYLYRLAEIAASKPAIQ